MSGFWEWNLRFLTWLSQSRTPVLTWILAALTWLGSEFVIIGVVSVLYLCVDKKLSYKLAFTFFGSAALVQVLKLACRIERPWVLIKNYPELEARYSPVDRLGSLAQATGYSFPSGHTQSITALCGTFAINVKKTWFRILMIAVALTVMFSRMYLGVHTLFDVAVSCLLTLACLAVVEIFFEKLYASRKYDLLVGALLCGVSLCAIVYAFIVYYSHPDTVDFAMVSDCLKASACGVGFGVGYVVERRWINFDPTAGKPWQKVLRVIAGVAGVFGVKESLKLVANAVAADNTGRAVFDILRYLLVAIFALIVMPLIVKSIHKNDGKKAAKTK